MLAFNRTFIESSNPDGSHICEPGSILNRRLSAKDLALQYASQALINDCLERGGNLTFDCDWGRVPDGVIDSVVLNWNVNGNIIETVNFSTSENLPTTEFNYRPIDFSRDIETEDEFNDRILTEAAKSIIRSSNSSATNNFEFGDYGSSSSYQNLSQNFGGGNSIPVEHDVSLVGTRYVYGVDSDGNDLIAEFSWNAHQIVPTRLDSCNPVIDPQSC